jgi:hypothetical protein
LQDWTQSFPPNSTSQIVDVQYQPIDPHSTRQLLADGIIAERLHATPSNRRTPAEVPDR